MRKFLGILFIIMSFCFSSGVYAGEITENSGISEEDIFSWSQRAHKDSVFQVSTYDAYEKGYYNQVETKVSVNKKYGNFGFGIMKNNTGALIFTGVKNWNAKNFKPVESLKEEYLPITYGMFKTFNTDDRVSVRNVSSLNDFAKKIDEQIETINYFIAIKAKGSFSSLILQSQQGEQRVIHNVKGTLIGFRVPDLYSKIAKAGYTLYFISDDKMIAGNVVELNSNVISCYLDYSNRLEIILPKKKDFKIKDFSQYDPIELNTKSADKKQTEKKDLQRIMKQGGTEPTPEEMMQMLAPKMSF